MAYISQYQYYENNGAAPENENWGSYQYVSLQDIVKNFQLMYAGNHSLVNNGPSETRVPKRARNMTACTPNSKHTLVHQLASYANPLLNRCNLPRAD